MLACRPFLSENLLAFRFTRVLVNEDAKPTIHMKRKLIGSMLAFGFIRDLALESTTEVELRLDSTPGDFLVVEKNVAVNADPETSMLLLLFLQSTRCFWRVCFTQQHKQKVTRTQRNLVRKWVDQSRCGSPRPPCPRRLAQGGRQNSSRRSRRSPVCD